MEKKTTAGMAIRGNSIGVALGTSFILASGSDILRYSLRRESLLAHLSVS